MNPIQALKNRQVTKEKEVEEKRMQQLLEKEEWQTARARGGGSLPPTPQAAKSLMLAAGVGEVSMPSSADTQAFDCSRMLGGQPPSGPSTPHCIHGGLDRFGGGNIEQDSYQDSSPGVSAYALESALTPLERRAARQAGQALPSPRSSINSSAKPPLPAGAVGSGAGGCMGGSAQTSRREGETHSAPTTLEQWRPSTSRELSPSRPALPGGEPSANARLRERMRQREAPTERSPVEQRPATSGGSWQNRIVARQQEVQEAQEIEALQKQQTDERSSRRNDVLRKVMERQAQRQQEVEGLEDD